MPTKWYKTVLWISSSLQLALLQPPVFVASQMDFLKFQYCHLCNQIKTGPNAWHLEPTPNLEKHSDKHQSLAEACSIMLHQQAEACICVYMSSHHFATNLCKRLPYTAAAFPWWSSGPPYSAAWGQRESWVQLVALAAMWRSTPRSGGPNPRKLCQDGARLKAHQLWDQGDMLDEMKHDNNDKTNQSLDGIKHRNLM